MGPISDRQRYSDALSCDTDEEARVCLQESSCCDVDGERGILWLTWQAYYVLLRMGIFGEPGCFVSVGDGDRHAMRPKHRTTGIQGLVWSRRRQLQAEEMEMGNEVERTAFSAIAWRVWEWALRTCSHCWQTVGFKYHAWYSRRSEY